MKTWNGIEKNSDAVVTFSAETEGEAYGRLNEIVRHPDGWYLECVGDLE